MPNRLKLIRFHLLGGCGYFLIAAVLHFTGMKVAGFYIFYDLPSEAYQDRIIAVLAIGWSAIYGLSAQDPLRYFSLTNLLVLIGFIGLTGMAANIWLIDYSRFEGTGTGSYWLQIIGLLFYILVLAWMNFSLAKAKNQQQVHVQPANE